MLMVVLEMFIENMPLINSCYFLLGRAATIYSLYLYFDVMFQRNVGQIRDDIISLSNKFGTLQTDSSAK